MEFSNKPNEVCRKAVKRGREFTLMVAGESGLGKSTLINSMFLSNIHNSERNAGPLNTNRRTVAVEAKTVLIEDFGVNLTLTVVDTPGFGHRVNNYNCLKTIEKYIDMKYEQYFRAHSLKNRNEIPDNRVHCCLYFIAPTGHGLKCLDIVCMKRLSRKVNLVPVIAKADTMTTEEMDRFKIQIMNEIAQHKIKIYDFPPSQGAEGENSKYTQYLPSRMPFAVVGCNKMIKLNDGKLIRGRYYPWGLVNIENKSHCDFSALRKMVMQSHLQNLKDTTCNVHYENYRRRRLSGRHLTSNSFRFANRNSLTRMNHEDELKKQKLEADLQQVFNMSGNEQLRKLSVLEVEEERRHIEFKIKLEQKKHQMVFGNRRKFH